MTELPKSADRADALRRLVVQTVEEIPGVGVADARSTRARRAPLIATVAAGTLLASVVAVAISVNGVPGTGSTDPGTGGTVGGGVTNGSRVKLYGSLDEPSSDSAAVAVGRVIAQETTDDGQLRSTVDVEAAYRPAELGTNAPGGARQPGTGDLVIVRQTGGPGVVTSAGPTLEAASEMPPLPDRDRTARRA